MVKLIIVEDETLTSDYMRDCLEWNEVGIQLCGVFYNGEQAYEYLQQNDVDIVVTDIKMPVMNGLMLVTKVLSEKKDVRFIVLSGYNDFHLVKEAFKLGVTDYILKTEFEPEMFKKVLDNVMATISPKSSPKVSGRLNFESREGMMKQFFWDTHQKERLPEQIRLDHASNIMIATVKLLNYNTVIDSQWNTEKELMKYGLANCIDEILDVYGNGEFFFNDYDEIIFLFSDNEKLRSDLSEIFRRISAVMLQNFDLVTAGGVCDMKHDCELKKQYALSKNILNYTFILGRNQILYYSDVNCFEERFLLNEWTERIERCIETFDFAGLEKALDRLDTLRPLAADIDSVTEFYTFLINSLKKALYFSGHTEQGDSLSDLSVSTEWIRSINEELRKVVAIIAKQVSYSDVVVMQIADFVRKNYFKDIKLQDLAKDYNYSYAGLSKYFQNVKGMSFTKFLTDVRMKEAMELILTTDFKMVEISTMVGYKNYENFSRAFKKKFKKWPNEIRKGEHS